MQTEREVDPPSRIRHQSHLAGFVRKRTNTGRPTARASVERRHRVGSSIRLLSRGSAHLLLAENYGRKGGALVREFVQSTALERDGQGKKEHKKKRMQIKNEFGESPKFDMTGHSPIPTLSAMERTPCGGSSGPGQTGVRLGADTPTLRATPRRCVRAGNTGLD